ncbi:tRNA pseudouridine synthase A [Xylella fastidiosa M23]|uniref:tRNA pseudouridine synthase A n=3 Tax=Xylella fastidiosa TaxID=2371 RepID=TRUA_XYLFT|nr:RecName: Full=tRNA pseudouridine synthase A; AltName: Full=tRNA pseudouridine(38-40) synthase; AltName: Full=tRNA pseudouridylate synthase I; AltName: Full=tRNA-uridine isomerase I [Xylella fastidiosa M23]Q87DS1.1 RecName: Full=tRNA pseudouridine synthase A; AltName: Full=tRNA pseudouridine(38-40) synthase; AltName: Full=tRNA pseudouridylate synthase I; AltName: Full=tRNA-uridine isomerase I [Xylella fastidiosa Temecula1]ACB92084.1 tRNA pseudouridine synthase A [Xylella fastidiosa M23]
MMRYALGVEYDGSEFLGWQQLGEMGPSVQATLQQALASVADSSVRVVCAGRTDAGVHGQCQVVHFDSAVTRPPRAWILGTTTRLPSSVAVRWCVPTSEDFHARFSACARRYRYRLLNRQVRPALQHQFLSWERHPLDAQAMHVAAQMLLGENDFSAFRSAQCQALHARRELQAISVRRDAEVIEICVQANAFLHHMVRNIVGSLLMVGTGERPMEWIAELLAGRDRTMAGPTASARGLVFVGPLYPEKWHLPMEVSV